MSASDSELIDNMGGTAEVAALCDVSMAAVSQWRLSGIPKARRMFLRLARPDTFKDETGVDVPTQTESQPQ
jgi:hypothetical protein